MYNVFTDFHHASLLQSFILLFEKRLGGNVFRPIGMEWAEQGFWKVYDHPATQAQFLGMEQGHRPADGSRSLNSFEAVGIIAGTDIYHDRIYHCHDIDSGKTNKAITLQTFLNLQIDIVIASIPQHIEPFRRLCELHPNKPKLIYQIGNSWTLDITQRRLLDGVMSSAKLPIILDVSGYNGDPLPMIEYHQEFDTDIFNPWDKKFGEGYWQGCNDKSIKSFVNCFGVDGLFAHDFALFEAVEKLMPDWKFSAHGGQCRDGAIGPASRLAEEMKSAQFIWHTKYGGDGYGHVIHNAAAVGRPIIVEQRYYQGKMANNLIKDGQTAIVIDNLSPAKVVEKIMYHAENDRWRQMCKNVENNFKQAVDFDAEFAAISKWLKNLL